MGDDTSAGHSSLHKLLLSFVTWAERCSVHVAGQLLSVCSKLLAP